MSYLPGYRTVVEARGTRLDLRFVLDPHGGWSVLWPDGGWFGRMDVDPMGGFDRLVTQGGRLRRADLEAVREACVHVLADLRDLAAAARAADRPGTSKPTAAPL